MRATRSACHSRPRSWCVSSSNRARATALANTSPMMVRRVITSSGQVRAPRSPPNESAPTTRPPTRSGIERCERSPIRRARSAYASGFRRQPVRQVRERDDAAGANLADQPRVHAKRTARERLDAADRRRAHDVQHPVGGKLGVRAAVVAERLDQPGERGLDLRDDAVVGDVGEAHREIGDQALESESIQARSIAVGALDALAVRSGRRRGSPHRYPSSRSVLLRRAGSARDREHKR